jgi:cell division septum initiation protein DivIVA
MTRPATDSGPTPMGEREVAHPGADTTADTREFSLPQLDDHTAEMRPVSQPAHAGPGFEVTWRGYDRGQVDTYRARLEAEVTSARDAHERLVRAHAQATERLRAAQSDLVRLRGQLTDSPSALSDRLREILHLAAQDAEQTRSDAQTDADKIRADAQTEADDIRARATNDAQALTRQARRNAERMLGEARAEQEHIKVEVEKQRDAARNEREQARAEADQARERADAEAAARRQAADRQAREQREQADAKASARLAELNRQLAALTEKRDEALGILAQLHKAVAKTLDASATPDKPEPSKQ